MQRSHLGQKNNSYYLTLLYSLGQAYGFEIQTLWNATPEQQHTILYGSDQPLWIEERNDYRTLLGVIPLLQRQYETSSELIKKAGTISNRSTLRSMSRKALGQKRYQCGWVVSDY